MRLLREILQRAGLDLVGYVLVGIGALLIASQLVVHRTRNLYVGLMGLALMVTAVRRSAGLPDPWDWLLLSLQVLAFGYAVALMFLQSWENVRKVRKEQLERQRQLIAELQEIAGRASPQVPSGSEGNADPSGAEAHAPHREEPT